MGKSIPLLLLVIFLSLSLYYVYRDGGKETPAVQTVEEATPRNTIILDGMSMTMVLDKEGNYVVMHAENAEYSRETGDIFLKAMSLDYQHGKQGVTTAADAGTFTDGNDLLMSGNVTGNINGVVFTTGTNGSLRYDMGGKTGDINGDILVSAGDHRMSSKSIAFSTESGMVEFRDNVSVTIQ